MPTTVLEKPVTNNTAQSEVVSVKPDFGNGRYSAEMERIWKGCKALLGIASDKAEKIARQAATDAGNAMKQCSAELRVSKASKDGKVTLNDAAKLKGVTMTNALSIVRSLQWIDDAGKNGISYSKTEWKVVQPVQEWIDSL